MAAHQAVQPAQHRLDVLRAAWQRAGARHHAGLVAHITTRRTAGGGARRRAVRRRRPVPAVQRIAELAGRRAAVAAMPAVPTVTAPATERTAQTGEPGVGHRRIAVAANEGPQVHVGQHVAFHQPAVGLVVGLFDQQRKVFVQRRLQLAPVVLRQAGAAPGVDDDARQHMGAQQVVRVDLAALLQVHDARAQIGELPGRTVHHGQRQARGHDLQLDGVVVHQRHRVHRGRRRRLELADARGRHTVHQRVAQAAHHAAVPGRGELHDVLHQVTPAHHHGVFRRFVQQALGRLAGFLHQAGQALHQLLGVQPPGLTRQCLECGAGDHGGCAVTREWGMADSTPRPRRSGRSGPGPWGRT